MNFLRINTPIWLPVPERCPGKPAIDRKRGVFNVINVTAKRPLDGHLVVA